MIRYWIGGMLLAGVPPPAFPAPAAAADDVRGLPMSFEWRREGPADCGKSCRAWISAGGSITGENPRQFETFAPGPDGHGAVLPLDSGGGRGLGTVEFGRLISRPALHQPAGGS